MQEQRDVPTRAKVIFTDYWCMLLFLIPSMLVVMAGGLAMTGRIDAAAVVSRAATAQFTALGRHGLMLGIAALLVVFCPPLLALRVGQIRRIFREGIEAEAEVVFFREFRDRGRIEFEFEHEDEIIHAANPVHLSRAVRSIYPGQLVTAVYLKELPNRAFIREIFL